MSQPLILNVDDDEAGRFAVTQMLLVSGFDVEEASCGVEALRKADVLPDLILLDVRLPDISGFEVCRKLKSNPRTAGITVIHLSASCVAPADRVVGLELGADGYLTEPVSQSELLATVRAFLRMRKAEAQQRFLATASQLLNATLDRDVVLASMARHVVSYLAEGCIVYEVAERGELKHRAVAANDASLEPELEDLAGRFPLSTDPGVGSAYFAAPGGVASESSDSRFAQDNPQARISRAWGARASLCVPLLARGRALGMMLLLSRDRSGRFGVEDLNLAEDLAGRVGLVLDNARLYAASQRAVRSRESLLNVVSHDLKNPVNTILMSAARGLQIAPTDEMGLRLRGKLETMRRAAERMNHLIHGLLDLASMESGTLSVTKRETAVSALFDEAMAMLEPLAVEKHIHLSVEACDAGVVVCDEERVLQVLSNLIGNAIKFTPELGRIGVRATHEATCVRFEVSDTGPGIHQADVPHLFDRYWQADRKSRHGTGLGLSIAKGIVEAHGGVIEVATQEGKGSTFTFTIPHPAGAKLA